MPRYYWKGAISFGLVSIPIMLVPMDKKSATISFHQIDKRDNSRIKYQRINANTGKTVPWEQIARGYEYDKDTIVPVPDEVLNRVAGEHTIDIENFIERKRLDIFTIENIYYILPDKKAEKGYIILREALMASHRIGIAKVTISTKEYLAAIIPHENALILSLLKYDNEVTKLSELELPAKELKAYKVTNKEIEIAKKLIKSMSKPWNPKKYEDKYQAALHEWVEETANHLPHSQKVQKPKKKSDNSADFVALLRKSLTAKPKAAKKTKTTKKPSLRHVQKQARHATKH